MCLRLQEKAFENKKKTFPGRISRTPPCSEFLCQVLTPPPPPGSEKLDPPLRNRSITTQQIGEMLD